MLEIMSLHSRKPCPVPSSDDQADVEVRLHSVGSPHRPHVPGHAGHRPGGYDHLLQSATYHNGRDSLLGCLGGHPKPRLSLGPELLQPLIQPDQLVDRAKSLS